MLSRVADALYWLGRYMERSCHGTRVIRVARDLQIDLREVDASLADSQWNATLAALRLPAGTSAMDGVLGRDQANSVLASITKARENARQVREVISSEMWEHLNSSFWHVQEAAKDTPEDRLDDVLGRVLTDSFVWAGVMNETMQRGEGWLFVRLGRLMERANNISQLLRVQHGAITAVGIEPTHANILWVSLLRSCSGLEAYRKLHPSRLDPRKLLGFLVLDARFPQSVHYAVANAEECVERLTQTDPRGKQVRRLFGRTRAHVAYVERSRILDAPADFLSDAQAHLHEGALALQRTYFFH